MSRHHANVATDNIGVKVSHVTHMNEYSLACVHHLGLGVKVSHTSAVILQERCLDMLASAPPPQHRTHGDVGVKVSHKGLTYDGRSEVAHGVSLLLDVLVTAPQLTPKNVVEVV